MMLTIQQIVKNGLFHFISLVDYGENQDTYHRVMQWPFQWLPASISGHEH